MPIEDDDRMRTILRDAMTIAVVGASTRPYRDGNRIADFLIRKGYTVYRSPDAVDEVVDEAIAVKAGVLWLQLDVVNEAAARRAEQAGLQVIMDHCIAIEYQRLRPTP